MPTPRLFAIIPAAGHSRRMGRPKLLLPLGGQTVIARVLQALALPEIVATVVVVRRDDAVLRDEVARNGSWVLSPDVDPPDMRASVEYGLHFVAKRYAPADSDGWLLLPADHPVLDQSVISELATRWLQDRPRFLVPTCNGRRGHPLLIRWDVVPEVLALPPEAGLNRLLQQHPEQVVAHPVQNAGVLTDLHRPDDYERLRAAGDSAERTP